MTNELSKDEILAEIERRWPSPNSGFYQGLHAGFLAGALWAGDRNGRV